MAGHCQQAVDAISKSSIALRLLDEILDAVFGVTSCGQGWVNTDGSPKTLNVSSDRANADCRISAPGRLMDAVLQAWYSTPGPVVSLCGSPTVPPVTHRRASDTPVHESREVIQPPCRRVTSPLSFASTIACAREWTPSFSKIRVT
jgi:hypothetical protein